MPVIERWLEGEMMVPGWGDCTVPKLTRTGDLLTIFLTGW